jgi:galactose mutarotase-like enzyme
MTTAFADTHSGFRVLGLRSAAVELRCAPELGGRVFSLVNRRTGREWLWRRTEGPELFRPADPRDFGTGTFAGLDECVPTIGACAWPDGRALADHGDVWAEAWNVTGHSDVGLTLIAAMPALGLHFTRQISVEDSVVRFDYALKNSGPTAVPALWAMHPLFTLVAGDRLELPLGVSELLLGGARPALPVNDPKSPVISFPEPAPGVRLDELALADVRDGYLKCFTPALPAGRASAALVNPGSGDRLQVSWDPATAPYLGLWLTRGGYRGWHHVALEPTNAPCDRADEAAANPKLAPAVRLAAGATRHWWVEWRVA